MRRLFCTAAASALLSFGSGLNAGIAIVADSEPSKPQEPLRLEGYCAAILGEDPMLAASSEAWPGLAAVTNQGNVTCNALIISPGWALTMDYCLDHADETTKIVAWARGQKVHAKIVDVSREPVSSTEISQQRLALVRLKPELKGVVPVALSNRRIDAAVLHDGACVALVGIGMTTESRNLDFQQVAVPIAPIPRCDEHLAAPGSPSPDGRSLCTGYDSGRPDACQGFAGGAVMAPAGNLGWRAVGMISWGKDCGNPGNVSISTRLAPAVDWIQQTIGSKPLPYTE